MISDWMANWLRENFPIEYNRGWMDSQAGAALKENPYPNEEGISLYKDRANAWNAGWYDYLNNTKD